MEEILKFKYPKDGTKVYPDHKMVEHWQFPEGEELEASIAHFLAKLAEQNGIGINEMQYLFPAVLKMFNSKSIWIQ